MYTSFTHLCAQIVRFDKQIYNTGGNMLCSDILKESMIKSIVALPLRITFIPKLFARTRNCRNVQTKQDRIDCDTKR